MKFNQQQIDLIEYRNTGKSKTNNAEFEKNGFLVLRNLVDITNVKHDMPPKRGHYIFQPGNKFSYSPVERQVKGSIARYYYPPYKEIFFDVKSKIQAEIGKKLEPTYYYDRFYFPGQELVKHLDRDSCEISVTLHLGSNSNIRWPIYIKSPDEYDETAKNKIIIKKGAERAIYLNPGDAIVYKGCERPHWRLPMPGKKRNILRRLLNKDDIFYHQIFFHYVLSDGHRVHFAGDRGLI